MPCRGFVPPRVHTHFSPKNPNITFMSRYAPNIPQIPPREPLTVCSTGISFKTQALYVGVFVARYLDLLYRWVSLYNFVMKIFFIASSVYILYLMKVKFRSVPLTYNSQLPSLTSHPLRPILRHLTCLHLCLLSNLFL